MLQNTLLFKLQRLQGNKNKIPMNFPSLKFNEIPIKFLASLFGINAYGNTKAQNKKSFLTRETKLDGLTMSGLKIYYKPTAVKTL